MGVMVGIALISTGVLFAQTKTIPGDKRTITGTVEAIQADTRELTLKGPKGNYVTVTVPPEVKRFSEIKVGDTISATYYENLVLRVKRPGEKVEDSEQAALTRSSGSPGATAAAQRTITATITEIDMAVPSITFSGPNNWKYSSKVVDKKALASVKVGDKVDITWTEAVLISVQPPEKKK
jgi:hypothetical protein